MRSKDLRQNPKSRAASSTAKMMTLMIKSLYILKKMISTKKNSKRVTLSSEEVKNHNLRIFPSLGSQSESLLMKELTNAR